MRRRTTPIGWPRRDPRHYRFALPNAVWEYHLKPVEFVIFSYLCYHSSASKATLEEIAAGVHMTVGTVKKYLDSLVVKELVSENGTPALNCKDEKFFTLPNEVFLLRLLPSAFLVYAYLLLIEDRKTHTCHPSYNTIASDTGLSKNTALKSIDILLEVGLITVKPSKLSHTLDKQRRKQLLQLVDAESQLRDDMVLDSFIAGFRLACGIGSELGKNNWYSYTKDEEQRLREIFDERREP